jgi:hypothetical protein
MINRGREQYGRSRDHSSRINNTIASLSVHVEGNPRPCHCSYSINPVITTMPVDILSSTLHGNAVVETKRAIPIEN